MGACQKGTCRPLVKVALRVPVVSVEARVQAQRRPVIGMQQAEGFLAGKLPLDMRLCVRECVELQKHALQTRQHPLSN